VSIENASLNCRSVASLLRSCGQEPRGATRKSTGGGGAWTDRVALDLWHGPIACPDGWRDNSVTANQLFEAGIKAPWFVRTVNFDASQRRLTIDFRRGTLYPPQGAGGGPADSRHVDQTAASPHFFPACLLPPGARSASSIAGRKGGPRRGPEGVRRAPGASSRRAARGMNPDCQLGQLPAEG
jgi:hypothetical protein